MAAPVSGNAESADARIAARIESAWRIQRRWGEIARRGSFEYAFDLRTWNSAHRLKESLERIVRVDSRDGVSRSEIVAARRDGHDDLEAARREQADAERKKRGSAKNENDFPSPFDPKFRDDYAFAEPSSGESGAILAFRPLRRMDAAIVGTVEFDGVGRPRKVAFTLAHPPIFTKNLRFTILLDEAGNPSRVDSSGEVSLIIWKRTFESTLVVRDVVPPTEKTP